MSMGWWRKWIRNTASLGHLSVSFGILGIAQDHPSKHDFYNLRYYFGLSKVLWCQHVPRTLAYCRRYQQFPALCRRFFRITFLLGVYLYLIQEWWHQNACGPQNHAYKSKSTTKLAEKCLVGRNYSPAKNFSNQNPSRHLGLGTQQSDRVDLNLH